MTASNIIRPFAELYTRSGWYPAVGARRNTVRKYYVSGARHPVYVGITFEGETFENTYIYDEDRSRWRHSIDDKPAAYDDLFSRPYSWWIGGIQLCVSANPNAAPDARYMEAKILFRKLFPRHPAAGNESWNWYDWRKAAAHLTYSRSK